jgi:2-dehydro-3-deoxygalactonokinase
VQLVPGLRTVDADGVPDVMRGEETQVLGVLGDDAGERLFVLPGTHSKWVHTANGQITGFRTYMTGELYAVLRQHSILGRLVVDGPADPAAFRLGLARGGEDGLDPRLFSVRTLGLFEKLAAASLPSYLSGLLIGSELAAATRGVSPGPVTIVGAAQLASLYADALTAFGWAAETAHSESVVEGLRRVVGQH